MKKTRCYKTTTLKNGQVTTQSGRVTFRRKGNWMIVESDGRRMRVWHPKPGGGER